MSVFSAVAFTLSTWLLLLVPILVFGASCLLWRIRGGKNIVRDFALYDGVVAYVATACLIIAFLPDAFWPGNVLLAIIGLFPALYAVIAYSHWDQGRRMTKVIGYFQQLRAEKRLSTPPATDTTVDAS